MCKIKEAKDMTVTEMRMSTAEDDLRDAGMLLGYALAAHNQGDETARKQFAVAADDRIGRVENCCAELRRML